MQLRNCEPSSTLWRNSPLPSLILGVLCRSKDAGCCSSGSSHTRIHGAITSNGNEYSKIEVVRIRIRIRIRQIIISWIWIRIQQKVVFEYKNIHSASVSDASAASVPTAELESELTPDCDLRQSRGWIGFLCWAQSLSNTQVLENQSVWTPTSRAYKPIPSIIPQQTYIHT